MVKQLVSNWTAVDLHYLFAGTITPLKLLYSRYCQHSLTAAAYPSWPAGSQCSHNCVDRNILLTTLQSSSGLKGSITLTDVNHF